MIEKLIEAIEDEVDGPISNLCFAVKSMNEGDHEKASEFLARYLLIRHCTHLEWCNHPERIFVDGVQMTKNTVTGTVEYRGRKKEVTLNI